MNLTRALYEHLAGSLEVVGMLATHDDQPAIFTGEPIPEDAEPPFLTAIGQMPGPRHNSKNSRMQTVMVDVGCYAAADGDATTVEALAHAVRDALESASLPLDSGRNLVCAPDWPMHAPAGPDLQARIVSVRLIVTG